MNELEGLLRMDDDLEAKKELIESAIRSEPSWVMRKLGEDLKRGHLLRLREARMRQELSHCGACWWLRLAQRLLFVRAFGLCFPLQRRSWWTRWTRVSRDSPGCVWSLQGACFCKRNDRACTSKLP